ncbi:MAG TPA: alpha/beta hydrolase [Gemmatimonadaceae bacterium]|nr:alpha/beta hydrolase [Gemmatimonadaceae bacterium]
MSNPIPPDVVRACVVAGDLNTHYYRAGRGEPLLLLADDESLRSGLLAGIPRQLRVLAPDSPASVFSESAEPGDFAAWLRSFLDALGLQRVTLVADAGFAAMALGFARTESERVTRLVVLQRGSRDESHAVWGVTDQNATEPTLLVVWLGRDEMGLNRILPRIIDFVGGRDSAPN